MTGTADGATGANKADKANGADVVGTTDPSWPETREASSPDAHDVVPRRPSPADGPLRRPETTTALQARPTTAVSSIDIQTVSFPDGSRGTFSTPGVSVTAAAATTTTPPTMTPPAATTPTTSPSLSLRAKAASGSRRTASGGMSTGTGMPDLDGVPSDAMSVMSLAPTVRPPGDLVSLAAGDLHRASRAWTLLRTQAASVPPFESTRMTRVPYALENFDGEFEALPEDDDHDHDDGHGHGDGHGDDDDAARLAAWKAKRKHYLILSSAGKPIWSRHGDLGLVNSYMGVVQTIIAFYEGAGHPLQGFTAGRARFVVVTEGPLYLVAISRLGESDAQLRDQLRALYMQILSTLTLPTLRAIFAHRPSADLRRPLQGSEGLLASLADSFTRGSPSALLGALECLRLRKAQRAAVTNTLLRQRADKLLYGLLVAGRRLVSVLRPRRHSLHPSDLQLIFNMLFESAGVQAGGGESWIPLCLPAFNNRGYLYMYVSFFDAADDPDHPPPPTLTSTSPPSSSAAADDAIAIVLISPDKESFFDLKAMRDRAAQNLAKNGSLAIIRAAVAAGRPQVADLVRRPGAASAVASTVQIRHFLYKSRANVQFAMSAEPPPPPPPPPSLQTSLPTSRQTSLQTASPSADDARRAREAHRHLMTLYHQLHAAVHARHAHLKILHCVGEDATSLAWLTPVFEFYCVAGPNASRALVAQDANRIVQWAKREEERLFIIGGGVF